MEEEEEEEEEVEKEEEKEDLSLHLCGFYEIIIVLCFV